MLSEKYKRFTGYDQEDAHEFLGCLLSCIEEEYKMKDSPSIEEKFDDKKIHSRNEFSLFNDNGEIIDLEEDLLNSSPLPETIFATPSDGKNCYFIFLKIFFFIYLFFYFLKFFLFFCFFLFILINIFIFIPLYFLFFILVKEDTKENKENKINEEDKTTDSKNIDLNQNISLLNDPCNKNFASEIVIHFICESCKKDTKKKEFFIDFSVEFLEGVQEKKSLQHLFDNFFSVNFFFFF